MYCLLLQASRDTLLFIVLGDILRTVLFKSHTLAFETPYLTLPLSVKTASYVLCSLIAHLRASQYENASPINFCECNQL